MKRLFDLCELGLYTLRGYQMTACDVRSCQRLAWGQRSLTHIFPAQSGLAVLAVDVSDSMKACQQHPLLGWPAAHVHHRIEEVGTPLTALEGLGDEVVVVGQVSTAVGTAIPPVTIIQVGLKRLGF